MVAPRRLLGADDVHRSLDATPSTHNESGDDGLLLLEELLGTHAAIKIVRAPDGLGDADSRFTAMIGGYHFSAATLAVALEKARRNNATKRCSRCKQSKPLYCFGKHRCKPDGLNYACKECERRTDRKKAWRQRRRQAR